MKTIFSLCVLVVCASVALGKPAGGDEVPILPPDPPDVIFYAAILEDPSDGTSPPPDSVESLTIGDSFFLEVWATKFSPDLDPDPPHDPGISCAYVDVVSYEPVDEIGIEYGADFGIGPPFESGTFAGSGNVEDLGSCNLAMGGVGVWPEWVLVARVELQQDYWGPVAFGLVEPDSPLRASVYGSGYADPVDYGDACGAVVE